MELRFVVPNMEKTFGNLEFAGENTTEQQRINGAEEKYDQPVVQDRCGMYSGSCDRAVIR